MLFSELYKITVNKVTFVGFRGAIALIAPLILQPPVSLTYFYRQDKRNAAGNSKKVVHPFSSLSFLNQAFFSKSRTESHFVKPGFPKLHKNEFGLSQIKRRSEVQKCLEFK